MCSSDLMREPSETGCCGARMPDVTPPIFCAMPADHVARGQEHAGGGFAWPSETEEAKARREEAHEALDAFLDARAAQDPNLPWSRGTHDARDRYDAAFLSALAAARSKGEK
jgi:hypothetical protein